MSDNLSVSELAAIFGRDRRSVQRLLRDVNPAEISSNGRRKYAREAVASILSGPLPSTALAEKYERLFSLRADLKALKRAVRTGERVRVDDVRAELSVRLVNLRSAVLGLHARYAMQIMTALAQADAARRLDALFAPAGDEIINDLLQPFSWEQYA